jgi:ubiquinone/menaquinone biosynthesis C-methylase UbiE
MQSESIKAYGIASRVSAYDRDMRIMHPLRSKMAEVALEVLPFTPQDSLQALDLGVGTGLLTTGFLERFPLSQVIAVDGAEAMIDLCRERLGAKSGQVTFLVADFRSLSAGQVKAESLDVVLSAFALHHLTGTEKKAVIAEALRWLKPGGWFVNADLVVAQSPEVERRIQELRVAGVTARAPDGDARFATQGATRAFLDQLEAAEQDQPLSLAADLELARAAGLSSVEVFWKEYREAVWGGPKRESVP